MSDFESLREQPLHERPSEVGEGVYILRTTLENMGAFAEVAVEEPVTPSHDAKVYDLAEHRLAPTPEITSDSIVTEQTTQLAEDNVYDLAAIRAHIAQLPVNPVTSDPQKVVGL